MKYRSTVISSIAAFTLVSSMAVQAKGSAESRLLERGHYLVRVGGCNDCHTTGYAESGGKTPVSKWLEGNPVGFKGPWGTTYPKNLRLYFSRITAQQWMKVARKPLRPPMPWFNLRVMSDYDLRAIYAYVHHLGPAGKPAPAFVPPGGVNQAAYINFMPQNLPKLAEKSH